MTGLYVKLDASYHLDDKVADLVHPESELMWVRILCHCKRLGNDGFVHRNLVPSIAPAFTHITPWDMVDDLTNTGLLIVVERGWTVVKWLKHNESPEEIDAKRQAAALRTAKWRERKRDDSVTRHSHITSSDGDVSTAHRQRHQPEPEPKPLVRRDSAAKRATPVAPDAAMSDAMRRYATDNRVDPDKEFIAWRDWHLAKGDAIKDHDASFRTWVRRAVEGGRSNVAPLRPTAPANRDHLALSYDWRQAPE